MMHRPFWCSAHSMLSAEGEVRVSARIGFERCMATQMPPTRTRGILPNQSELARNSLDAACGPPYCRRHAALCGHPSKLAQ